MVSSSVRPSNSTVGILMGNVGCGKTSVFNKLCGTEFVTVDTDESLTQNIFSRPVGVGNTPNFFIIDTPGTGSNVKVFEHAVLLKTALTFEPINTIFVLVEYASRTSNMVHEFEEIVRPLKRKGYHTKICLIITKFDNCKPKVQAQRRDDIQKYFINDKNVSPTVDHFIFSDEDLEDDVLADEMFAVCQKMPKTKLEYNEAEFAENFPLATLDAKMRETMKDCKQKFEAEKEKWIHLIGNLDTYCNSNSEFKEYHDDILINGLNEVKQEHHKIISGFQKKFENEMQDLTYYGVFIEFQALMREHESELKRLVFSAMKNQIKPTDNVFRKCNHADCGLIWFKFAGCDGSTTCGRRDSGKDVAKKAGIFAKYTFSFFGFGASGGSSKSFQIKKNNIQQVTKKEEYVAKREAKALGCGRTIVWSELPTVSDAELEKFYKECPGIKDMVDETLKSIGKGVDLKKKEQAVDKTINFTATK